MAPDVDKEVLVLVLMLTRPLDKVHVHPASVLGSLNLKPGGGMSNWQGELVGRLEDSSH
jgi:hypothetical protein